MRKKDLLEIPIFNRKSEPGHKKYIAEAKVLTHKEIKYLVIDMFYSLNDKPTYRTFFDESMNYLTYDYNLDRWLTGTLDKIVDYGRFSANDHITKKINQFIRQRHISSIEDNAYTTIYRYQEEILSLNYKARMVKETKHIDDYLNSEITPLPDDWDYWIDEKAMDHSRYIIYEYTGKDKQLAYCTHCKKDLIVTGAKHNELGTCPKCESKITFKSSGKVKALYDDGRALYVQPLTDGGVMFRNFGIHKTYHREGGYKKPQISVYEYKRVVYDINLNIKARYNWEQYKGWKVRWCEGTYSTPDGASIYPGSIKKDLIDKYDCFKYSAIDILSSNTGRYIDLASYQNTIAGSNCCYSNMPCTIAQYKQAIEKLIKVGLYRMAAEIIESGTRDIDYRADTPNKILKLEHDDIKLLIEADSGLYGLKYFKIVRGQGYRYTSKQIESVTNWKNDFEQIISSGVHPGRVIKYLQARSSDFITSYKDYLHGCRELNYNLSNDFVAFPKYLKQSHDEVVKILNNTKLEKERKKKNKEQKEIKKLEKDLNIIYGFDDKKYFIRAPHDAGEIILEGQTLHHCVGRMGYIERMASKQTVILFLRKKSEPDKPYYTIETFNGSVRQVHGFGNDDKDIKEIQSFINKFKKKIKTTDLQIGA